MSKIYWLGTARLAGLRAFAASIVWCIGSIWVPPPDGEPRYVLLMSLFGFILLFALPIMGVSAVLSRAGVPFAGPFSRFIALICVVGDPIVWILHKIKPNWVGVDRFGLINPAFVFVYKPMTLSESEAEHAHLPETLVS